MTPDGTPTMDRLLQRIPQVEAEVQGASRSGAISQITHKVLVNGLRRLREKIEARGELDVEPLPVAEEIDAMSLKVLDNLSMMLASDDPAARAQIQSIATALDSLSAQLEDVQAEIDDDD